MFLVIKFKVPIFKIILEDNPLPTISIKYTPLFSFDICLDKSKVFVTNFVEFSSKVKFSSIFVIIPSTLIKLVIGDFFSK